MTSHNNTRCIAIVCALVSFCFACQETTSTPHAHDDVPNAEEALVSNAKPTAPVQKTKEAPQKLIVLGGSITETVFALGHGKHIVATDVSSLYPKEVHTLPKVGYYRKISAEPILALSPTHILADKDTGPPAVLEQLRTAGIQVTLLPNDASVEGALARMETLGSLLQAPKEAKTLQDTLRSDLAKAKTCADTLKTPPRVLFLYARGMKTLLVSGQNTPAESMISLAGATNAAQGFDSFKPLTPEAVVQAQPDVVLIPERGLKSLEEAGGVWTLPGMAQTPAAKHKAVIAMDDLALLGFGPRMGKALLELCTQLKTHVQQ